MPGVLAEGGDRRARRVWAGYVRGLRTRRGWTQAGLARALASAGAVTRRVTPDWRHVQRIVQYWEAAATSPGEDYAVTLIVTVAEPGELATGTINESSELDRLLEAFAAMGVPVDRRRLLLNAAATAAAGAATFADWLPGPGDLAGEDRLAWLAAHPGRHDHQALTYLEQQALALLNAASRAPARELHGALLDQALLRYGQAAALRARAPLAAACTGHALGAVLMRLDQRYAPAAFALHERAALAAQEVGVPWLEASARSSLAVLSLDAHEDPQAALAFMDRAVALTRHGGSPTVAGWLRAFHGEVAAAMGRWDGRAFAEARELLGSPPAGDPQAGAYAPSEVSYVEGIALLRLGDAGRAAAALEAAAGELGPERERRRALTLGALGLALAQQGEPDRACAALHQALDHGVAQESRGRTWVRQALAALRPWRHRADVREVRERAGAG